MSKETILMTENQWTNSQLSNEEYEKAAEMKKIIEEEFKQLESEKKNETK